jgi:adenylate cyclase
MAKDHLARKLAVILHADVVSSTALVRKNEATAHKRIQAAFHQFSETIESYGGKAREIRGDALVAEFERASDAVAAALAFQVSNAELNTTIEDDIQPQIRIGISLGEVIFADNTITGTGVVLAQRLEQLSDPGGVVVQGSVSETVPTRMPFNFDSLGEHMLKGFDQPVRAFTASMQADKEIPAPELIDTPNYPESGDIRIPHKPSIAVLPFDNMSTEPEQEFFADGMAEDIIAALSQISTLAVVARNSSFAYKDRSVKVQDIASDLGVRYILEGSVRKSGNRARITAQLIDALDGNHLWAERYDRELDDVFEVQDEITRNVAIALQVELSSGEHARIWQSGTRSFAAWQCQIRGVQGFYKFTAEGRREALDCFEQAVSIDAEYLPAWAALGHTLYQAARFGDSGNSAPLLERVEQISKKLLEHENSRANGYALQSNLRQREGQHDLALTAARQAVELAPDSPDHRGRLALVLVYGGEPSEALKQFGIATQLSPHFPNWLTIIPLMAHYFLGDLEKAREAAEQSLASFPDYPYAYLNLAGIYSALGLQAKAHDMATSLLRLQPMFSLADYRKSQLFINPEDTDTWIDHLSEAGLPD